MSRTLPSWLMARHRYCRRPFIVKIHLVEVPIVSPGRGWRRRRLAAYRVDLAHHCRDRLVRDYHAADQQELLDLAGA